MAFETHGGKIELKLSAEALTPFGGLVPFVGVPLFGVPLFGVCLLPCLRIA